MPKVRIQKDLIDALGNLDEDLRCSVQKAFERGHNLALRINAGERLGKTPYFANRPSSPFTLTELLTKSGNTYVEETSPRSIDFKEEELRWLFDVDASLAGKARYPTLVKRLIGLYVESYNQDLGALLLRSPNGESAEVLTPRTQANIGSWRSWSASPEGELALLRYQKSGVGEDHLWTKMAEEEAIRIAQVLTVLWFGHSTEWETYVESDSFRMACQSVLEARRTAFADDPSARRAYEWLNTYSIDKVENEEFESCFEALHGYFVNRAGESKERLDALNPANLNDDNGSIVPLELCRALAEHNRYEKIFTYRSLDCRTSQWVRMEAQRLYPGEIDGLTELVIRFLAKCPENLEMRSNSFLSLLNIDQTRQEKRSQANTLEISDIKKLKSTDPVGWKKYRSWVVSRDQESRAAVLHGLLEAFLEGATVGGTPGLSFSYRAYDVANGRPESSFGNSSCRVHRNEKARQLVAYAAHVRENEDPERTYIKAGSGVSYKEERNGSVSWVMVAHTLKRIFALQITAPAENAHHVLNALTRVKQRVHLTNGISELDETQIVDSPPRKHASSK